MKMVAKTYLQRIPLTYVDPIVNSVTTSWPIVGSSVVTAGAVGTYGGVTQAVADSATGTDVTAQKPAASESLPAKNENDKSELTIGEPSGLKASKPPATGRIKLRADD